MTAIGKSLREDISCVCESMIMITDKSDCLISRRNMAVDGISEAPPETWMVAEDNVREMI